MTPKKYKSTKKLWESAAAFGKVALCIAEGESGVLFIAKDEGAAAIVLAEAEDLENAKLVKTWKMFRTRLDDMIRHAESGGFPQGTGTQAFIRDTETGDYEKID